MSRETVYLPDDLCICGFTFEQHLRYDGKYGALKAFEFNGRNKKLNKIDRRERILKLREEARNNSRTKKETPKSHFTRG